MQRATLLDLDRPEILEATERPAKILTEPIPPAGLTGQRCIPLGKPDRTGPAGAHLAPVVVDAMAGSGQRDHHRPRGAGQRHLTDPTPVGVGARRADRGAGPLAPNVF